MEGSGLLCCLVRVAPRGCGGGDGIRLHQQATGRVSTAPSGECGDGGGVRIYLPRLHRPFLLFPFLPFTIQFRFQPRRPPCFFLYLLTLPLFLWLGYGPPKRKTRHGDVSAPSSTPAAAAAAAVPAVLRATHTPNHHIQWTSAIISRATSGRSKFKGL